MSDKTGNPILTLTDLTLVESAYVHTRSKMFSRSEKHASHEAPKIKGISTLPTNRGSVAGGRDLLSGTTAVDESMPSLHATGAVPKADLMFTNVSELLAYINTRPRDIDSIVVGNVTRKTFTAIDQGLQGQGRLFFFGKQKLLIITIPNSSHESLHLGLNSDIQAHMNTMGLQRSWWTTGATRFPPGLTSGAVSQGEGDSGGRPLAERSSGESWPTLIIEAGFTQSLVSLRAKMHFWFANSNHEVKIVILAKAFPGDASQKRILFEQWQEHEAITTRPGATTTRSLSSSSITMLQPTCIQTINIVWSLPGVSYEDASLAQRLDPTSFNVTRGPLRLDFTRLFLRLPANATEHDIVLSDEALVWYASHVWN